MLVHNRLVTVIKLRVYQEHSGLFYWVRGKYRINDINMSIAIAIFYRKKDIIYFNKKFICSNGQKKTHPSDGLSAVLLFIFGIVVFF